MDDPEGMLIGLDREFGVLTFDGTQAYFVLDGQHRLRSIKDAMKQNPELGRRHLHNRHALRHSRGATEDAAVVLQHQQERQADGYGSTSPWTKMWASPS